MRAKRIVRTRKWIFVSGLVTLLAWSECPAGEPPAAAATAFNRYVDGLEARLARERHAPGGRGAPRQRELRIERVEDANVESTPGAMVHHWRASGFAAGARAADFERVMQDFGSYPRYFAPEVERSRVLARQGDSFAVTMRVKQKHVIPVVMDTTYDVQFGRMDERRGWSASRSTRIAEIAGAGTVSERVLAGEEEHGFLWRQNTYWSYEERDGGLYLEVESVSLTRAIPRGLAWAVQPFVESVPRESLEFTLRATCDAIRKGGR